MTSRLDAHKPEAHRDHSWKYPVRAATSSNGNFTTSFAAGQGLDGVTLVFGDRILIKDQSTGSQNGIYVAQSSNAPVRAYDMDTGLETVGSLTFVIGGTVNGGKLFKNTNTSTVTIGSMALTFAEITPSSVTAASVSVADAGGYFTGTDVEAVLQELASKDIGYQAHGNTGSTETFSALTGWHSATLDANSTFTFTGATSGLVAGMVLELAQDGTGSRLVTWPGSVVWPGGTAPTLSTTPSTTDILTFFSRDGGTTWYGFHSSAVSGSSSGSQQHILLADGHATPFVFNDLLQMDDGSDFMWSDP